MIKTVKGQERLPPIIGVIGSIVEHRGEQSLRVRRILNVHPDSYKEPAMTFQNRRVTGKAFRSFDEQFPAAEPGFETDEGMTKALADAACDVCGRRTPWFHFKLAVYLCSQDCLTHCQSKRR
jgi:hypothetical protein